MDDLLLNKIAEAVNQWRENSFDGVKPETKRFLENVIQKSFLRKAQIEALQTYVFLKEIKNNSSTVSLFKEMFQSKKEMLKALGLTSDQILDLIEDGAKIDELINTRFETTPYPNSIFALAMGSGKTILMATIMLYEFILGFKYPEDKRFAKNALIFAPDTTIIESLKEIKTFDYTKVIPKEFQDIILNIKYHYLVDISTPLPIIEGSNFNVIVSNSQKIILKTVSVKKGLLTDDNVQEKIEFANARLRALKRLSNLVVFIDEAHHAYGTTLEGLIKKTRLTINHLHENEEIVGVANFTGTPYVNNKMLPDVVYSYGLKQGIEDGILKQVSFYQADDVKDESFIKEVLKRFFDEYKDLKVEGMLPKIAIYAASIDELQNSLRPIVEKTLANMGLNTDMVLEFHTKAENGKKDFDLVDTPESKKQVILLVGKGTEGWNCRSLFSTALYRKPSSNIFVLQSATRALRAVGDNSRKATIFLSTDNYKVFDRELKSNFNISAGELAGQEQEKVEHTLKVLKTFKIKVKKPMVEIKQSKVKSPQSVKFDPVSLLEGLKTSSMGKKGEIILTEEKRAVLEINERLNDIQDDKSFTEFEIYHSLAEKTGLSFLYIKEFLAGKDFLSLANKNNRLIDATAEFILENVFEYERLETIIEEEIELTKAYPFSISVLKNKNGLVVYKEQLDEEQGIKRLGFHVNPYNFDSADEKELFKFLRQFLDINEAIKDIYFTGGVSSSNHTDFFFEYFNPTEKRVARYFPDFLISTTKNRYLVIEVKEGGQIESLYQDSKRRFETSGNREEIVSEVFAKELGFRDFQKFNKEFEYRIVFNAQLKSKQEELISFIKSKF